MNKIINGIEYELAPQTDQEVKEECGCAGCVACPGCGGDHSLHDDICIEFDITCIDSYHMVWKEVERVTRN